MPYSNNTSEDKIIDVFHRSTHGLTNRASREAIIAVAGPHLEQVSFNNARGEEDKDFNAHAENLSHYDRILEISKEGHKQGFLLLTNPVLLAARDEQDEVLYKKYQETLAGFTEPT